MSWLYPLLALLGGVALAVQVGMNNTLRVIVGSATLAALISFAVGLLGLLLVVLPTRSGIPGHEALAAAPWWAWAGGLLGAFYVTVAALIGQRIGMTALLALTVTGQLVASLVMDQYGVMGIAQQSISISRFAGALLLVAGVLLVVR